MHFGLGANKVNRIVTNGRLKLSAMYIAFYWVGMLGQISAAGISIPKSQIPDSISHDLKTQIEKLYSYDPVVRANTCAEIVDEPEKAVPAIPFLIALLDDEYPLKTFAQIATSPGEEALEALIKIGAPCMEQMREALNNNNLKIQLKTISYFRTIKDARATDALKAACGFPDASIRLKAIQSLGKKKDPDSYAVFVRALRDTVDDIRASAAYGLGVLSDAKAADPLLFAFNDKSMVVRRNAVIALGRLGVQSSVDALISLLRDSTLCTDAIFALGSLKNDRALDGLEQILAAQVGYRRNNTLLAIGSIGSSRAIDFLVKEAAKNPDAKITVIKAFGNTENGEAVVFLAPYAKDGGFDIRNEVADALGKINAPQSGDILIGLLNDRKATVRSAAAKSLGLLKCSRAEGNLIGLLSDGDREGRISAIEALDSLRDPASIPYLRKCTKDADLSVKKTAIKALGGLHSPQSLGTFISLLSKEKDAEVVLNAIEYSPSMKNKKILTALIKLLDNSNGIQTFTFSTDNAETESSRNSRIIKKEALKKLCALTGQNYFYDIPAWRKWLDAQDFSPAKAPVNIQVPFVLNFLDGPESIIQSVGADKFQSSRITIVEVAPNNIAGVKGTQVIYQGGVTGLFTPNDTNHLFHYDLNKERQFLCVGTIVMAPNLKISIGIDGTLFSGPDGAVFKRSLTGKELTLVEGSAFIIGPVTDEGPESATTEGDYKKSNANHQEIDASGATTRPRHVNDSPEENGAEVWPHKGSLSLAITDQISNGMTGAQKFIDAEDNFLKSLHLAQTVKDASGQIIFATPINNYNYSPDITLFGLKAEYFLNDRMSLGLHFYSCFYGQSLGITIGDSNYTGSGNLISLYGLGPSVTRYLYLKHRFGISLHGDLGFAFGKTVSLAALDSLRKLGALDNVSGLSELVQSKNVEANISGIQGNIAFCVNWFIARWFSLDAGLSCYFFTASLNADLFMKEYLPNTPTTIGTIMPALYIGIKFCLFNKGSGQQNP
jgi:HEAT repeat protein